jgi:hypothetical protein
VRILQRHGDLVEFAYLLVAVLHQIATLATQDVVCDLIEGKILVTRVTIIRI